MFPQPVDLSKSFTLDEYIRAEENGIERHEYFYGKLVTMPAESLLHNETCLNVLFVLKHALERSNVEIYVENVKVKVEEIYLYPDIVVMKDQPTADLPYKDYIIYQPLLIAEILWNSTRKYDLGDKVIQYQKISSLQYYLAVEPLKQVVIFYEKDESNNWFAKTFTENAETIALPKLDAVITLGDIYAGR